MGVAAERQGEDVEDDFVSPLTMIRGVLEMLRDSADLPQASARRFLDLALDDCDRLAESIDRLIENNPDFIKRSKRRVRPDVEADMLMTDRLSLHEVDAVAEIDFSDCHFRSSDVVDIVYDHIDQRLQATGRQWFLMVNFRNCRIEPEAWVAFSHRGKQTNLAYSLGTVRYAVPVDAKSGLGQSGRGSQQPSDMFRSRQAALDYIRKERAVRDGGKR